jgi:hypothetical protein
VEHDGEADGAQEPERVFPEPLGGVADGAENPVLQVFPAVGEIMENVADRVVEEGVDGEVAPGRVGGGGAEGDGDGVAAVEILSVASERGDLGLDGAVQDADDAEVGADGHVAREQGLDTLRRRAGGHVNVLRIQPQQRVADAPAHPVGFKSVLLETLDDPAGTGDHGVLFVPLHHGMLPPCCFAFQQRKRAEARTTN